MGLFSSSAALMLVRVGEGPDLEDALLELLGEAGIAALSSEGIHLLADTNKSWRTEVRTSTYELQGESAGKITFVVYDMLGPPYLKVTITGSKDLAQRGKRALAKVSRDLSSALPNFVFQ